MKHAIDILNERLHLLASLMRRYRDDAEWGTFVGGKVWEAWQVEAQEIVAALRVLNGEEAT